MKRAPQSVAPLRLPFDASFPMPGSKSHANRAIIAACLSRGSTTIRNATPCDDVALLVKNLAKMGFAIRYRDLKNGVLSIRGGIPRMRGHPEPLELFCGNAGTTLRFLTALACVVPGSFVITGNAAMRKRPIGDLVAALRALGADIADTGGYPPVRIGAVTIRGGPVFLQAQKSSQYLSALLLVAPLLRDGLSIRISGTLPSQRYVALTKAVLRDFGVRVSQRGSSFSVSGMQQYRSPSEYVVEGDFSAAGAFLVLAELTESRVRFSNLPMHSLQADAVLPSIIERMRRSGNLTIDCSAMPDQLMNLAVLAAFRKGRTTFTGAANLRYKECDRLAVLTRELRKTGIDIRERPDGVVIRGRARLRAALLDPHGDHRMAFCFAILGSVHPGIRIRHPGCVSKSYPGFFRDLRLIHRFSRPVAIVGMRGAGKTMLGKRLAASLGLHHVDTDTEFEREHGEVRAFVDKKGFPSFRAKEERIVSESLQPGRIVSLGGGAIESTLTRTLLKEKAIVLYLQAPTSVLIQRLRENKRPPLTALPLEKEVPFILQKRAPLYRSIADISLTESDGIPAVLRSLRALCSS